MSKSKPATSIVIREYKRPMDTIATLAGAPAMALGWDAKIRDQETGRLELVGFGMATTRPMAESEAQKAIARIQAIRS